MLHGSFQIKCHNCYNTWHELDLTGMLHFIPAKIQQDRHLQSQLSPEGAPRPLSTGLGPKAVQYISTKLPRKDMGESENHRRNDSGTLKGGVF